MSKSASGKANSGNGSNNKRKYRDADWLRQQYVVEEKSTNEIAEEFDYGSTTISTWLDKHGIEKRSQSEAVSKAVKPDALYADEEWLKEGYVKEKKSMTELAAETDSSTTTISRWLRKHGIKIRDASWNAAKGNRTPGPWDDKDWLHTEYIEKGKSSTDIAGEHDVSETLISSRLDEHNIPRRNSGTKGAKWYEGKKYTDYDWLQTEYIEKGRDGYELSNECGVTPDTIYHWLEKHDIDRPHIGSRTGEEHPAWKGGCDSIDYGSNWGKQREKVKERDNHKCQDCGVCKHNNDKYFDVHHIIPIKEFDDTEKANRLDNLILLCRSCHKKWEGTYLRPDTRE